MALESSVSPSPSNDKQHSVEAEAEARRSELYKIAPGETETPETILKRQLARHGEKYTNQRREILISVLNTHAHFDADWLFTDVNQHGVKAAKATVYRTLELLSKCGLVREVFHGPHGAYYEHVYGHQHHEHMICLDCGKVIEFTSRRLERLQDEACRAHGFHADRHHLQVFGYCSDCHPCKAAFPPLDPPSEH